MIFNVFSHYLTLCIEWVESTFHPNIMPQNTYSEGKASTGVELMVCMNKPIWPCRKTFFSFEASPGKVNVFCLMKIWFFFSFWLIALKFSPRNSVDYILSSNDAMIWHRKRDTPLYEPVSLADICSGRHQWVNHARFAAEYVKWFSFPSSTY